MPEHPLRKRAERALGQALALVADVDANWRCDAPEQNLVATVSEDCATSSLILSV
jgi:hypothetical protein